jgi:hypothetical protein
VSFKIALLRRTEGLVKKDLDRPMKQSQGFDFVRFASPDKKGSIWGFSFASQTCNWVQAGCFSEQTQFNQIGIKVRQAKINTDQKRRCCFFHGHFRQIQQPLVARGTTKPQRAWSGCDFASFRRAESDRATGNDGRNSVFVDHLGDRVSQQNNVLVEGLNLTLQLDAIYQVNGHWHMLFAQCIQEGVLQKLAFVAHDILRVQKFERLDLTTGHGVAL